MGTDESQRPWTVQETAFPSDGTVAEQSRFLLRYAILAPSTHNSQPWEFAIDDGTVYVFADESRWLQVADPEKRELYISLGCAIENFLLAADHFGFDTSVEYDPHEEPDAVASIILWRDDGVATTSDLFSVITERQTNRNVYDEQQIPGDVLDRIEESASEDDVAVLLGDDQTKAKIANLQREADERQFDDPNYRRELGRWIGSGSLGTSWLVARIGQLAVTHLDLGRWEGTQNSRLLRSAPEVALVLTESNDTASQIAAGRAFERVFLIAIAQGVAVHPMNQILQLPDLKQELIDHIDANGRSLQLLFRMGYGPPEESRRPRRSVEAVLRHS